MKKTIAILIVGTLTLLAPGLPAYAAAGEIFENGGAENAQHALPPQAESFSLDSPALGASRIESDHLDVSDGLGADLSAMPLASDSAKSDDENSSAASNGGAQNPAGPKEAQGQPADLSSRAAEVNSIVSNDMPKTGLSGLPALAAYVWQRLIGAKAEKPRGGMQVGVAGTSGISNSADAKKSASEDETRKFEKPSRAPLSENLRAIPPPPPSHHAPTALGGSGGSSADSSLSIGARVVLGAALTIGIQLAAAAIFPAAFGIVPMAAAWAAINGLLIVPFGIWARLDMARHDSQRLDPVKHSLDLSFGQYLGAVAFAVPGLAKSATAAVSGFKLLAAASSWPAGAHAFLGLSSLPLIAVAAHPLIGLGSILGMIALTRMMQSAFYLLWITKSAESGKALHLPAMGNPLKKGAETTVRFPSSSWLYMGVAYALMSGFSGTSKIINAAMVLWQMFSDNQFAWKKGAPLKDNLKMLLTDFNVLYGALAAVTGGAYLLTLFVPALHFAVPISFPFMLLVFAVERGSMFNEWRLMKMLPEGKPAPSSNAEALTQPHRTIGDLLQEKFPTFHPWIRTAFLIGGMASFAFVVGAFGTGFASLLGAAKIAVPLVALQIYFAIPMIKKLEGTRPTDREHSRALIMINEVLTEAINVKHAKKGLKPVPMPEAAIDPNPLLNAFATGPSPRRALVAQTLGLKRFLESPEQIRAVLIYQVQTAPPDSDAFDVFRMALTAPKANGNVLDMVESLPRSPNATLEERDQWVQKALAILTPGLGVRPDATPDDIVAALRAASTQDLLNLGVAELLGVFGHERSHVQDRHMIVGGLAGALNSTVAFATINKIWAVAHYNKANAKFMAATGQSKAASGADASKDLKGFGGIVPAAIASAIGAPVSLSVLAKDMVLQWAQIVMLVGTMASSRNDEAQADKDGGVLTGRPEVLALALGSLEAYYATIGKTVRLRRDRLIRMSAIAHLYTINPFELLKAAHKSSAASRPATPEDEKEIKVFDLFQMNHPETPQRIKDLRGQAIQQRGGTPLSLNDASPGSPPGQGPPPVGPKSNGGVFRGLWSIAKKLWSMLPEKPRQRIEDALTVLPESSRNQELWKFMAVQGAALFGASFSAPILPDIVPQLSPVASPSDLAAQTARMGEQRDFNWVGQLSSNLLAGSELDRDLPGLIMDWAYGILAVLGFGVAILCFYHGLSVWGFMALVGAMGFLRNLAVNASAVAFNRYLGSYEASYNKANAVYNVLIALASTVALGLGSRFYGIAVHFILANGLPDQKDHARLLAGGLAYAVGGLFSLVTSVSNRLFVNVPKDDLLDAREGLAKWLSKQSYASSVKGVSAMRQRGRSYLRVHLAPGSEELESLPSRYPAFSGYEVRPVAEKSRWAEIKNSFLLIWKDFFLKWNLLLATLSTAIGDALVYVGVPRYLQAHAIPMAPEVKNLALAAVVVGAAGHGGKRGSNAMRKKISALALLWSVLSIFGGGNGGDNVFGFYLTAVGLGGLLASMLSMFLQDKPSGALSLLSSQAPQRFAAAGAVLTESQIHAMSTAIMGAPEPVLAAYKGQWSADPSREVSAAQFTADLLAQVRARIAAQVYEGKKSEAEVSRLLEVSGLDSALSSWAAAYREPLFRETLGELGTVSARLPRSGRWSKMLDVMDRLRASLGKGLTRIQWQGRWSSVLSAAGWLFVIPMFMTPVHWVSIAMCFLAVFLQNISAIIWSSLQQKRLNDAYQDDQGKIIAFSSSYQILTALVGTLLLGGLTFGPHVFKGLLSMEWPAVLKLIAGLSIACGICDVADIAGPLNVLKDSKDSDDPSADGPKAP